MQLIRRGFLAGIAAAAVGALFPEMARAKGPVEGDVEPAEWYWKGENKTKVADDAVADYAKYFEDDFSALESKYGPRSSENPIVAAIGELDGDRLLSVAVPFESRHVYVRHVLVDDADEVTKEATVVYGFEDSDTDINLAAEAKNAQEIADPAIQPMAGGYGCTPATTRCKCRSGCSQCRTCRGFDTGAWTTCCAGCL